MSWLQGLEGPEGLQPGSVVVLGAGLNFEKAGCRMLVVLGAGLKAGCLIVAVIVEGLGAGCLTLAALEAGLTDSVAGCCWPVPAVLLPHSEWQLGGHWTGADRAQGHKMYVERWHHLVGSVS